MKKIGVQAGGRSVERVADAGVGKFTMRDKGLRPEPDDERKRREGDADEQSAAGVIARQFAHS